MTHHPSARILLADDEAAIRFTMEILLRRQGYTITTATNGSEALALVEQQPFELLLLDLKMPGLSGLEVAQRACELQPTAAILILTGSTRIEGAPDEEGLDEFDYILKTASPRDVLERVAAILA
ncbi:MAG TPA: response regulator [Roseiflexaceae bacterium]|nr:response regulator [Roseiflexaceae bacterium]